MINRPAASFSWPLLLLAIFCSFTLLGQVEDYVSTPTKPFGWYGAISYAVQPMPDDGLDFLPTLSGGLIIDKKWMVGIAITQVNSELRYTYQGNNGPLPGLESGYSLAALDVAYVLLPENKAHPIFQMQIGGGEAWMKNSAGNDFTRSNVVALHPKIGLQLEAATWFRMDFMVGYQALFGLNDYFSENPYNGPVAGINLRFGKFVKD
jgi:hypothetical protein